MAELTWDKGGERLFETGVDHGVLYIPNEQGVFDTGVAWNGLVTVTEAPSGAEASPQYADNIKYLNLTSAEEFGATVEAFTFPDEFGQFDGTAEPVPGVQISQQSRGTFGLSYRSLIGNDLVGTEFGEKIHLVYGAQAAPSEKARTTVNDSPEAMTLSWELTTTAVPVGVVAGKLYKPTAHLVVDSTKVDAADFTAFKALIYGTPALEPKLPTPAEVIALFATA